jgi:hypothetical protein
MLNLDDRPSLPSIPQFSRDLETFLVDAARPDPAEPARPARRAHVPWGWTISGASVAAAAIAVAVAVGVNSGGGPSRTPVADPSGAGRGSSTPVHIHLAAFSVDTQPGGTVALTVSRAQVFDPAAMTKALAQAGVPALVTVGRVCQDGPTAILNQVISAPRTQPDGDTVTTITPSALPAGMELSIGYFSVPSGAGVHITIVPVQGPLTCSSTPPNR